MNEEIYSFRSCLIVGESRSTGLRLEWFLDQNGRQDHDTVSSLKLGLLFHLATLLDLLHDPGQHGLPQIRMSQFSPPENDRHFDFLSFFQKALDVPNFELKIMGFRL